MGTVGGAERRLEVVQVSPWLTRDRLAVGAAFAAVYFIWGSTYLAIAWAVEAIPPLLMIGARALLAGAVLYGWARLRGAGRPGLADWRAALVAGILLFVTGQAVLAWSETRIASGAASLLIATEPLFIALLGWGGGRLTGASSARPGRGVVGAIVLGFLGVAVLVRPGAGGGLDPVGAGAAVLASFSWSVGVYRAGSRPGVGPGQMAGMQLLTAGLVLFLVSALVGESWTPPPGGYGLRALAAFFYLVILGSVVAFGAYVWLLGRVGPSRLSTHAYVNPLVAVALGILLNGEPLSAGLLLATGLILGSVALLLRLPSGGETRPVRPGPALPDAGAGRTRRRVRRWRRRSGRARERDRAGSAEREAPGGPIDAAGQRPRPIETSERRFA